MKRHETPTIVALPRRHLLAAVLACMAGWTATAQAQIEGLEIIAPGGPGGGYDQLARTTQEILEAKQRARAPGLMIAGLGMVGAIHINNSPVTLDQVTPLARLTGEYQPLVVAADSPIRTLDDRIQQAVLLGKVEVDHGA